MIIQCAASLCRDLTLHYGQNSWLARFKTGDDNQAGVRGWLAEIHTRKHTHAQEDGEAQWNFDERERLHHKTTGIVFLKLACTTLLSCSFNMLHCLIKKKKKSHTMDPLLWQPRSCYQQLWIITNRQDKLWLMSKRKKKATDLSAWCSKSHTSGLNTYYFECKSVLILRGIWKCSVLFTLYTLGKKAILVP